MLPVAGASGRQRPWRMPKISVNATRMSAGRSGKGTEQAVDELHPRVEGVEVGVIVAGVVLPKAAVAVGAQRMVPDRWSAGRPQ